MLYSLNEKIKELRISQGYSQVEFARHLGVTKQCVSNWENDNVVPSIEMLVKIADQFNVSTDYILSRSTEAYIDVKGLTVEQIGHISLIIKDLQIMNRLKGK